MDRIVTTGIVRAIVALALATSGVTAPGAVSGASERSVEQRIDAAFEYLFPVYESARLRFNAIDNPRNPARRAANVAFHTRRLADHDSRAVTAPNNDTLYTTAWLDLSAGAALVSVPRIARRYWSVSLIDVFTNNFAVLGNRLDGEGPIRALVVGPDWQGEAPHGVRVIRAPGNDVWLLGRWLIDGSDDAPAVHAIQDATRIESRAQPQGVRRVVPHGSHDPANFLAVVNEMLARNPVPAAERVLVEGWGDLGVGRGEAAWGALSEALRQAWRARIEPAHAALRQPVGSGTRAVAGWSYPAPELGNFGANYALRSRVALGGIAALVPQEAIYLGAGTDAAGAALHGARRYRLTIPAAGVEADAFWSLSVYELMPDGRRFFVDNPLRRYSVGDRTRGLVRNADGSIDVWVQREQPAGELAPNWLPAPPGRFTVSLRAYHPRAALREGRAALPRIEAID